MVTSPPDNKRDDKHLYRRAQRESLYRHSIQSEARLAAEQAAQRAVGMATAPQSTDESVASEMSAELAIQRGSQRALLDSFEEASRRGSQPHSIAEFDLTTVTEEDATTNRTNSVLIETPTSRSRRDTKKKKRRRIRMPRKKSKLSVGSGRRSGLFKYADNTNRDAWMCGVCGKVFTTFASAEVHEQQCIRELVKAETASDTKPPATPKGVCSQEPLSNVARLPDTKDVDPSDASFRSAISSVASSGSISLRIRKSVDFADLHPLTSGEVAEAQGSKIQKPILRKPMTPVPFPNLTSPTVGKGQKDQALKNRDSMIITAKSALHRTIIPVSGAGEDDDLLLPATMRQYVVLSDEALVNVVLRATPLALNPQQIKAERDLALLALDKSYYDAMAQRALDRSKYLIKKSKGTGIYSKVHNKFVDAYQLIKEGDGEGGMTTDQYTRKRKGGSNEASEIVHTDATMYVNVVVKQSIQVVSNELERLAKERWDDEKNMRKIESMDEKSARFERFKAFAHANAVKIAGLALASDFTPRRIAVQLSNDLYRLTPQKLKRVGVGVDIEIEYRVGPYFVLAVNIKTIQWRKIMAYSHKETLRRKQKWAQEQNRRDELNAEQEKPSKLRRSVQWLQTLRRLTIFEVIAQQLSWLNHFPLIISIPICWILYYFLFDATMRRFILITVTNDIFSYVEEKGMEMEVKVQEARYQAAFMLSALRELREDSRELKKKRKETESAEKGEVLGPLLGPAIKLDKTPATPPPDFEPPENLETVVLELELAVGFRRLRWAMLSMKSTFITEAFFAAESKYLDITYGEWSKKKDVIGLPTLPDGVKEEDIVDAELEASYLMPKSAFVSANMCYETRKITHYNDHVFCLRNQARTPGVPYGSTFVAWTQIAITNTGNDSCRMVCSVEAEFPNGAPMVASQIRSGMRSGTAVSFVLLGETIVKYADEYP